MIKYLLILVTALSLSFTSCNLLPSSSSNGSSASIASKDPVVIAEISVRIAYDSMDTLDALERQNHALLVQRAPAVVSAVNGLRIRMPILLASARSVTKAYAANSSPENLINLQAALATLNQAVIESQSYSAQVAALKK